MPGETAKEFDYLYGPVPSRRLGRSLGVDLVPYKVCSFDCIYCQLGHTTDLTLERKPYMSADDICPEFQQWMELDGDADFVTLAGSGEPTLNSELGQIIECIQAACDIPTCILTNGSLLWDESVRAQLTNIDVLSPSLDAATQETFERVNRPAGDLQIAQIIEGIQAARRECSGEMWLEIMLVAGINDTDDELRALKNAIGVIEPARVQLNTVVRPPTESNIEALTPDRLSHVQAALGAKAEIIAPLPEDYAGASDHQHTEEDVLDLLRRRPCTVRDIAQGLGTHPNDAVKYVQALISRGEVREIKKDNAKFYMPA